jgi:hypothetical protein
MKLTLIFLVVAALRKLGDDDATISLPIPTSARSDLKET